MKRAWKSIVRQPSKSVILLITIAILGTLIAGAVSIKQGLVASEKTMAGKVKIYATIQPKNTSTTGAMTVKDLSNVAPLDSKLVAQIAALPQVKTYENTNFVTFSTGNLVSNTMGAGTSRDASFKVYGVQADKLLDYTSGDLYIVNGRWLTEEDEKSPINPIVISDAVAGKNRLNVGSQITLETKNLAMTIGDSLADDTYEKATQTTFTIVGTYGAADKYVTGSGGSLQSITAYVNMNMYTTQNVLKPVIDKTVEKSISLGTTTDKLNSKSLSYNQLNRYAPSGFSVLPTLTIWLNTRADADKFVDAVNALGLPSGYEVTVATAAYDQTMSPMNNLNWIVDIIVVASVLITVVILGLVIMMILRTRKTEIGTLFSLGERKSRIAVQLVSEVVLVAVLGLTISVFSGGKLTQGLSEKMLQGEVTKMLETQEYAGSTVDGTALHSLSQDDGSKMGADTVALIYVIGLLTAGMATVAPVVYTLRRPPKIILS